MWNYFWWDEHRLYYYQLGLHFIFVNGSLGLYTPTTLAFVIILPMKVGPFISLFGLAMA